MYSNNNVIQKSGLDSQGNIFLFTRVQAERSIPFKHIAYDIRKHVVSLTKRWI